MINWAMFTIYALMIFNLIYGTIMHGEERADWNAVVVFLDVMLTIVLVWWATGWVIW